jgi:DNA-binding IclR family transcriptional regulator
LVNDDRSVRRRGRPAAPARDAADPEAKEVRVEAVERALTLLDAFRIEEPRLTLAQLAQRTGFYPSTILRLSASLARFGYLHRRADGLFQLGPTPLRLGVVYRQGFDLTDFVRPTLARLVERTQETAAFYVRDGDRRICLYRHHASRIIRHHLEEGAELPLDRGAGGRVLLAYTGGEDAVSERIKASGVYVSLGERDPETAAIAAPVFGSGRAFLGALGIVGLRSRMEGSVTEALTRTLIEEAGTLMRALENR